jgi:NAD(P)-dependent dehydrogenase (short-subunit alcohol dehydrogenase family)
MTSRPLVFVTGATQGIGLATAKALAIEHSYHVLIGARNKQTGDKIASELRAAGHEASTVELDLTSPTSIAAAASHIEQQFGYLDVLINNAAILIDLQKGLASWDLYSQTFTTNIIGTATLTDALIPLLRKAKVSPPRLIFLSSTMGSLEISQDQSTPFYSTDYKAYDASKAAVNMLMLNYDRNLRDAGVKVNSVCPGLVKSNLTAYSDYGTSTEEGAKRVVELATVGKDGPSGTFSNLAGPVPF